MSHIETNSTNVLMENNDNSGYTPLFQTIIALMIGVLFSPFSYGFFYLLITLLFFEIANADYNHHKYNNRYIFIRLGLCMASIFGFIIGRYVINKDRSPFRYDFLKEEDKYSKWFKEENKTNKCDEEHKWCNND